MPGERRRNGGERDTARSRSRSRIPTRITGNGPREGRSSPTAPVTARARHKDGAAVPPPKDGGGGGRGYEQLVGVACRGSVTQCGRGLTGCVPLSPPVGGADRGHAPSPPSVDLLPVPPRPTDPPRINTVTHGRRVPWSPRLIYCPLPEGGHRHRGCASVPVPLPRVPPLPVSLHVAFLQQLLGDPAVLGGGPCQQHRGGFGTRPPLRVSADLQRGEG